MIALALELLTIALGSFVLGILAERRRWHRSFRITKV